MQRLQKQDNMIYLNNKYIGTLMTRIAYDNTRIQILFNLKQSA